MNKLITQLQINDKIIEEPLEISDALRSFYKNLCSQKLNENDDSYQTSLNLFLLNENSKMLTQEDEELCDCELSKEEILNSLKDLQKSKTPGTDGLPADLYKSSG